MGPKKEEAGVNVDESFAESEAANAVQSAKAKMLAAADAGWEQEAGAAISEPSCYGGKGQRHNPS